VRVAFYGRVSTEEQADRGNISNQVEFAKRYFDLHGPQENIEGYDLYLDEGISGTLSMEERPEGFRLMAEARAGKVSAVYFYRLDRLARSTQVVLNTYYELERLNIAIKSMTEAFDTGTPVGKFFMTLLASIAALERDTIQERTQMGKERKAREGCWTSGPSPFGYRIGPDKRLLVHQPEAQTVRLIYRLYNEGMSMVPLAQYLNAMGIPTPAVSKGSKKNSAGQWHAGHLSIILRSRLYTGEYRTMRRSQKGREGHIINVEAIIPRAEFERTRTILSENGELARGGRGRQYPLRGVIYCGHCGLAMVGNSGSTRGLFYYRCTGTVNHGRGKVCGNRQIRAEELERAIWDEIIEFFKKPGKFIEMARNRLDQTVKETLPSEDQLEQAERAMSLKKEARSRILSMVSRSLISPLEAEYELKKLAGEIIWLEGRLGDLAAAQEEGAIDGALCSTDLLKLISQSVEKIEPHREIIKLLVARVVVTARESGGKRDVKAVVYYRFRPGE